jgi:hypothetical protein
MLFAKPNPRAVSCCFTWAMNGARFSTTLPFTTSRVPLPWPDSTFTTPACTVLVACTQMVAIAGLATILATAVPMKLLMPLTMVPEKFFTSCDNRGR